MLMQLSLSQRFNNPETPRLLIGNSLKGFFKGNYSLKKKH